MIDAFKSTADDVFSDVVDLRRTLHRHPELSGEEHETARRVAERLQGLGLTVRTGIHGTGVLGLLDGGKPGPTLLLRGDMDALPIREETGLDFASENEGVMHACGHDVHTSSLLGAAMVLAEHQEDVHGQVRFCFQPHEERLPGGAKFMIEEGVLDDIDGVAGPAAVFGQHVKPGLPAGTIGVRSGWSMASSDEVYVTVNGEGGHAASPHELATDATVVASEIVVALQSIISRRCPPDVPSVLTIGRLIADGATNVIPETARLEGTFRAMDEDWRFRAHDLIRRVATHTAEAHGATADVEVKVGYPALYNHEEPTALVKAAAIDFLGEEHTVDVDPWFAGEDFAYFLRECPGSFYQLGAGTEHGLHTSKFATDEEALRTGTGFMAYLAWRYGAEA
ncbi:N-acyl-L-amino acid amidohydrolase [Salinibacter sp. 10B]|uniref:M20 metallopeptidase family protein n=1 Tax=Salinibacter sp. 10B TaxID=1923971 RepID=UPI000CF4CF33|nr:M20 family metallopeptidase [Salinibacter sp. 10B]PQJ33706.1 N-acyl-L-amino acid amidohydrolase [Salinibacter sp. 10B]